MADDVEWDGSEGTVPHTGGYIDTTKSYSMKFLEDVVVTQAGGILYGGSGLQTDGVVFEPGSTLTFTGSDGVNWLQTTTVANEYYAWLRIQGTEAKPVTIQGADSSNRCYCGIGFYYAAYAEISYLNLNFFKYYGLIYSTTYTSNTSIYNNIVMDKTGTSAGDGIYNPALNWQHYKDCTISTGGTNRVYNRLRNGNVIFENCTSDINTTYFAFDNYTCNLVFVGDWATTWAEDHIFYAFAYAYHRGMVYLCKNITINVEDENGDPVEDAYVSIQYPLFDSLDVEEKSNIKKKDFFKRTGYTDASGQFKTWVPYRKIIFYGDTSVYPDPAEEYDLSVDGGTGGLNTEYDFMVVKENYRIIETSVYMDSDTTWNPALVPEATFDDIVDHLTDIKGTGFVKDTNSLVNLAWQDTVDDIEGKIDTMSPKVDDILVDTGTTLLDKLQDTENNTEDILTGITDIKGTGFVKDTDSLVDLAHIGADGDTLETLSDQIDLVATQTSVDTIDGIVDAILEDTGTTIPASLARVLGLVQENQYIDTQVYDAKHNLTSARLRTYSVAGSVGTDSDVLATYELTATYNSKSELTSYKMVIV